MSLVERFEMIAKGEGTEEIPDAQPGDLADVAVTTAVYEADDEHIRTEATIESLDEDGRVGRGRGGGAAVSVPNRPQWVGRDQILPSYLIEGRAYIRHLERLLRRREWAAYRQCCECLTYCEDCGGCRCKGHASGCGYAHTLAQIPEEPL